MMNISLKAKILFFSIIGVFIFIPVIFYIFTGQSTDLSKTTGDATVIIDNQAKYNNGIHEKTFSDIGKTAYISIGLNIETPSDFYHGTIRDNTFSKNGNTFEFILDVPEAQYSWRVVQTVDTDGYGVSDVLVVCVDDAFVIYKKDSYCIDISTALLQTDPVKTKFAEVLKSLPLSGPSFYMTYTESPTRVGESALSVKFYTNSGKDDALKALSSLGYNPEEYEIIYTDART